MAFLGTDDRGFLLACASPRHWHRVAGDQSGETEDAPTIKLGSSHLLIDGFWPLNLTQDSLYPFFLALCGWEADCGSSTRTIEAKEKGRWMYCVGRGQRKREKKKNPPLIKTQINKPQEMLTSERRYFLLGQWVLVVPDSPRQAERNRKDPDANHSSTKS